MLGKNKVQYIVRKLIMAGSVKEALRLSESTEATDVYVDDKWMDKQSAYPVIKGFNEPIKNKKKRAKVKKAKKA